MQVKLRSWSAAVCVLAGIGSAACAESTEEPAPRETRGGSSSVGGSAGAGSLGGSTSNAGRSGAPATNAGSAGSAGAGGASSQAGSGPNAGGGGAAGSMSMMEGGAAGSAGTGNQGGSASSDVCQSGMPCPDFVLPCQPASCTNGHVPFCFCGGGEQPVVECQEGGESC